MAGGQNQGVRNNILAEGERVWVRPTIGREPDGRQTDFAILRGLSRWISFFFLPFSFPLLFRTRILHFLFSFHIFLTCVKYVLVYLLSK